MPVSWTNRASGESKLRLREMGSRYLFIVLYVFLEHHLTRGDYRRPGESVSPRAAKLAQKVTEASGSTHRFRRVPDDRDE